MNPVCNDQAYLLRDGVAPESFEPEPHDPARWKIKWKLTKYDAPTLEEAVASGEKPYEVIEYEGNLLMYGGVSCLWECLVGNGVTTGGLALTYFNNTQAAIGVGDSATAASAAQTNLQAATNKLRVAMSSTYPQHTDGVIVGSATVTFQSAFGGGQANYAWNECGVFNSTTDTVGRMLNRLAPGGGFGTKSGGTWSLNIAITIS